MANKAPLLADELNPSERVLLASLKQHPGFVILEKLLMAACKRSTEEVIKLDPTEEGYERKLKALQSQARERNQFSLLLLQSMEWQAAMAAAQAIEEKEEEPEVNRIVRPLVRPKVEEQ